MSCESNEIIRPNNATRETRYEMQNPDLGKYEKTSY